MNIVAKERKSLSSIIFTTDNKAIKALIISSISILFVFLLLFTKVTQYSYNNIKFSLTGYQILTSLFFGGSFFYNNFGTILEVPTPIILALIIIIQITLAIVSSIISLLNAFKYKKDDNLPGYICLASAIITTVIYILLITSSVFKATNHDGNIQQFYRFFSFEMSILALICLQAFIGCIQLTLKLNLMTSVKKNFVKYLLLIVPTVYLFIFCIYPMFLQLVLSFKEYKIVNGIWGSEWIGFKNFEKIFVDPDMQKIMWNTVYISFIRLAVGIVFPLVFSLILFDMAFQKYKKVVQTIVYIPHFFSWVIIYAIVYAFLTPDGIINNIRINSGSDIIDFLSREDLFIPILIISSTWKELGWGTIMYLAALSNVDNSLFEAAEVDGAGVFRKMFSITLPSIMPIISFMTIMSVGNILKGAGGEQILIFANSAVKEKANVIDTWVYWQGLGKLEYGIGAAVSFVQSLIGIILVLICNKISKKTTGIGAW